MAKRRGTGVTEDHGTAGTAGTADIAGVAETVGAGGLVGGVEGPAPGVEPRPREIR